MDNDGLGTMFANLQIDKESNPAHKYDMSWLEHNIQEVERHCSQPLIDDDDVWWFKCQGALCTMSKSHSFGDACAVLRIMVRYLTALVEIADSDIHIRYPCEYNKTVCKCMLTIANICDQHDVLAEPQLGVDMHAVLQQCHALMEQNPSYATYVLYVYKGLCRNKEQHAHLSTTFGTIGLTSFNILLWMAPQHKHLDDERALGGIRAVMLCLSHWGESTDEDGIITYSSLLLQVSMTLMSFENFGEQLPLQIDVINTMLMMINVLMVNARVGTSVMFLTRTVLQRYLLYFENQAGRETADLLAYDISLMLGKCV